MTGLPFPYIEVSVKEGKLIMDAGGQAGEIKPTAVSDQFDADGRATILFLRNDARQVVKLKMDAMGFSFEGAKE
jgi:cytochrome c